MRWRDDNRLIKRAKEYCYISKAKCGGIHLECSYDQKFIETLKRHIPPEHRKWEPGLKQWWISDQYAHQAEIDAKVFYEKVTEC